MDYKKCASVIQFSSLVIIVTHSIVTFTHWFFPATYQSWYQACGIGIGRSYDTTLFSVGQRVSGFMVEAMASVLLIYGLILVIQLMAQIKEKNYFTSDAIMLLKRITKIALFYTVYEVLAGVVLSVITSLHNPPGQRVIALTFGTSDVLNIMLFCCLFLILTIVKKGHEMKHEQELTI